VRLSEILKNEKVIINIYETMLQKDPNNIDYLLIIIELFDKNRNYEKGILFLDQLILLVPYNLELVVKKFKYLTNLKKLNQAYEFLNGYLIKFPKNFSLILCLGRVNH
jgi:tetratricopeptide (TPR) repeat protein